jgi:hypothetical protein
MTTYQELAAHLAAMSLAADEQADRMIVLDPDRSYYRGLAVAYRTSHDLLVGIGTESGR